MFRKLTTMFMALCVIFSCFVSPAMAADNDSEQNILVTDGMVMELPGLSTASPCGTGGPAPLVTNIELAGAGKLKSTGNFGILLKVTGYGHDRAYFDGVEVDSEEVDYFINYGTTADGFYYLYDVGFMPATGSGNHTFTVTFRSVRDSNKTMTFTQNFPF